MTMTATMDSALTPDAAQSIAAATVARTSSQPISEEMRVWIIDHASAGEPVDEMLKAMQASGWGEDDATAVMTTVLREITEDPALACGLPPPCPVPEPVPPGAPQVLQVGGREVRVLMSLRKPRVVVFGGLLSDAECDELIEQASERLTRSTTVDSNTGDSEVHAARTSQGMFFNRGQTPLCKRIEARIEALLGWPVENGEGLQILRYGPGAEYKPHHDYFDLASPGTPKNLLRGGQRVASLVCYLNTPTKGGTTVFPDVNLDVAPIKGNAVFFSYDRPHAMTRTLHGGAPVIEGEKWVATKWLRERAFV
jgi:prolyl 4-hydroxylase